MEPEILTRGQMGAIFYIYSLSTILICFLVVDLCYIHNRCIIYHKNGIFNAKLIFKGSSRAKIYSVFKYGNFGSLRVYLHVDRSTGAHHRLSAHKHHRCAPDRTGSTQLLFTTNGCEHPARCAPVRSIMTIHLYVVGPCLPCF